MGAVSPHPPKRIVYHDKTLTSGVMETGDKPTIRQLYRSYAFIPAGIFFGLGIGLILNFPVVGALIGLGLGIVATSSKHHGVAESSPASIPAKDDVKRRSWSLIYLVTLLVLFAIILWGPLLIWRLDLAIICIVMGMGFVTLGFGKRT